MYATNRLLGLESLSLSLLRAQAPQIPVKPSQEVQTLLDAAAKLPKADQLAAYEKAMDAAIASKDPAGARFAARELRNVLIALKRTSEVEPYLLGLQKRAQQVKFPLMEAHVVVNLAITFESAKQFDKAIVAYESAGKLFEASGDKSGQSRAVGNMASTLSDIGKTAEASVAFDRALPLAKESGDQAQVASVLGLSAANMKKLGKLDDAIAQYDESIAIYRRVGDRALVAVVISSLASLYKDRGVIDKALALHEEALEIRRSSSNKSGVAASLNDIANIQNERGDFDKALKTYEEANAIFVQLGEKNASATVISNIATIYRDRGDLDKALAIHEESLVIKRSLNDKSGIATSLNNIANIYSDRGDLDKALALHEESLAIKRSLGDNSGIAASLNNIANIHDDRGDLDKALAMHEESLAIKRSLGDKSGIATSINNIANIYKDRGDLDKASAMHEESLAIRRSIGDKSGIASSLTNIANIYYKRGDLPTALAKYEEALVIARSLGEKSVTATLLGNIATIYDDRGDVDKALALNEEALAIRRALGDQAGIASSLNSIGNKYYNLGILTEAFPRYQEAYDIAKSLGMKGNLATYSYNLSAYYDRVGNEGNSLTYLQESLRYAEQSQNKERIADAKGRLAAHAWGRGDFDSYQRGMQDALSTYRSIGNSVGISGVLRSLGSNSSFQGHYSEALQYLNEALDIAQKSGIKTSIASPLSTRGNLWTLIGQYAKAENDLNSAQKIYDEIKNLSGKLSALTSLGILALEQGKSDLALSRFEAAYKLGIESNPGLQGNGQSNIAEALQKLGRHAEALTRFESSLAYKRAHNNKATEGYTVARMATSLIALGRLSDAQTALRSAISLCEQSKDRESLALACRQLAEMYEKSGDLSVAILFAKKAVDAQEERRTASRSLEQAAQDTLKSIVSLDYKYLASLLVKSGRTAEAEQVLGLLKQAEIQLVGGMDESRKATLTRTAGEAAAEDAYGKATAEVGSLGARLQELLALKHRLKSQDAEVLQLTSKLEAAEAEFNKRFDSIVNSAKAQGAALGRMDKLQESKDGIASALASLPPRSAAVYLLCTPDVVQFIVITPSVKLVRSRRITSSELASRIMAFRSVLDNPAKDAVPAARALYDVLWKPIAADIARLGAVNVMLSLDGPVRYIPMGALHDGKDWLASRYNLSLFMPAALGKIAQKPSPIWNVFTAGVSKSRSVDDGFGTQVDFSPLPGVSREVNRIGSVMRSGGAPCLDDSFTLDAFKLGLLSQPRVVHLASHFQFNPGSESKSFLLTGKGDVLRVSDTRVLTPVAFRSVELLTLSACQTGMSTEKADGSEVEGISGILQRKGAAAVLSTLWPVADESTEAFMSSFYALRSKSPGVTKVQCLRQIQVAMIQGQLAPGTGNKAASRAGATRSTAKVATQSNQRTWSHPYYWAPFILQGNWM